MLSKPGKLSAKILKNHYLSSHACQGIFSTYWGYVTFSDLYGQSVFPRKQQKGTFKLLITEKIIPIIMIGNTIHHWEINPIIATELYSIELKQDPKTKHFYWETASIPLPSNNRIQLDTIVIFAKPKDLYIYQGKSRTYETENFILPDIYAKKNLNRISPALWILNVRQFFGPLTKELIKKSDTYYSDQLNQ